MATTREFRSGERIVFIRESGDPGGRGVSDIPDGTGIRDIPSAPVSDVPSHPAHVLVHGLGVAHEDWDAMAEVIEPTGTVYALVGDSTGAQVVAEAAARHPELVDRCLVVRRQPATDARPPHRARATRDRSRDARDPR